MGRTSKLKGNRTHGRGKKAGRGKGKRGGRGLAGLHKHRYITYLKDMPEHFGMHGFKRPQGTKHQPVIINIRDLEENFQNLLDEGHIRKDGDFFSIDLNEIGVEKLLGTGNPSRKYKITVESASGSANDKISKADGELNLE